MVFVDCLINYGVGWCFRCWCDLYCFIVLLTCVFDVLLCRCTHVLHCPSPMLCCHIVVLSCWSVGVLLLFSWYGALALLCRRVVALVCHLVAVLLSLEGGASLYKSTIVLLTLWWM